MVTTTFRNVTLSANAVLNGAPMPCFAPAASYVDVLLTPGRGDFAARTGGRIRRRDRRAAIGAKRAFLASC